MDYKVLSSELLLSACTEASEPAAWEEFIRRFNPLITRVVLRTARHWGDCSRSLIDDLVQETYLKLCSDNLRLLRTFQPRQLDAIYAFLKAVTSNVVHDHFKAVHAAKRAPELFATTELSTRPTSGKLPLASTQPSLERSILLQQIDYHLMKCTPSQDASRNRLVFWLYYRCGLTASAIASLPNIGLTTKGVESALLRLTRLVKTAMTETRSEGDQDQPNSSNPKGFRRPKSL